MNMIFQLFIITYILYSDAEGFKFSLCKRYSRDYQSYLLVYWLFFK